MSINIKNPVKPFDFNDWYPNTTSTIVDNTTYVPPVVEDNTTYVPPVVEDDEWEEEITIIRRRRKKKPVDVQPSPTIPWPPDLPVKPYTKPYDPFTTPLTWSEPCAFDRLPPGIYGLACFCRKCCPAC